MEITIRRPDLTRIKVLDILNSIIWTDRYDRYGDFEIFTKVSSDYIAALQEDYILESKESEHAMTVESIELVTDTEDGDKYKVTGRSLESILNRRIIWKQTTLSGGFQNGIKRLLMENIISPEDPDRKIPNFIFEESSDLSILNLSVDAQFWGGFLYDAIQGLCEANGIGFKITLSDNNEFVFKLYSGVDRSYTQNINPIVSFSTSLDNLQNTNYFHSKANHRTISLVAGEGEGADKISIQVALPEIDNTGLNRRELFTDASDVSRNTDEGLLDIDRYATLLAQKGIIDLLNNQQVSSFDGTVIPTINYVYGKDFFMGDIVQMENEYKLKGRTRVVELIISEDLSGRNKYPTFKSI